MYPAPFEAVWIAFVAKRFHLNISRNRIAFVQNGEFNFRSITHDLDHALGANRKACLPGESLNGRGRYRLLWNIDMFGRFGTTWRDRGSHISDSA